MGGYAKPQNRKASEYSGRKLVRSNNRSATSGSSLSRAVGGLVGTVAVFALPGSTAACELAMTKLVLPEAVHVAKLAAPAKWK